MAEEEKGESEDSLLCLQVVRKIEKLMTCIRVCVGNSRMSVQFQLDSEASWNVLSYSYYCDPRKPSLDGKKSKIR